ncbi:MAG TPA: hypothetical protein VGF69_23480 [Thermoanaerobaculia bacterium]|jgi:hypothetical protein
MTVTDSWEEIPRTCSRCSADISIGNLAPTPEARADGICAGCREALIDLEMRSCRLKPPSPPAEKYAYRQTVAARIGLGRAADWRRPRARAAPSLHTAEGRAALLRYIETETLRRFGPSADDDAINEQQMLEKWDEGPDGSCFGVPAHMYSTCLVVPRPPGAPDPLMTLECSRCHRTEQVPVPELVPFPSRFGGWLLERLPMMPLNAACRRCEADLMFLWENISRVAVHL